MSNPSTTQPRNWLQHRSERLSTVSDTITAHLQEQHGDDAWKAPARLIEQAAFFVLADQRLERLTDDEYQALLARLNGAVDALIDTHAAPLLRELRTITAIPTDTQ